MMIVSGLIGFDYFFDLVDTDIFQNEANRSLFDVRNSYNTAMIGGHIHENIYHLLEYIPGSMLFCDVRISD